GSKVGLMARASLDADSSEVSVVLQRVAAGTEVRLLTRSAKHARTDFVAAARADRWPRLQRNRSGFGASSSPDRASTWAEVGTAKVDLPAEVLAGVAATETVNQGARRFVVARVCDLSLAKSCSTEPTFRRGDANADGKADITDAVAILGYLFLGDAEL